MLILITGGSKSGKSSLAETIITSYDTKRYYIAAMQPFGEEALAAIKRHKAMRSEKHFETIEQYTDIQNVCVQNKSAVLLECIGNLCANEMFENNIDNPTPKILYGIKKLSEQSEILVVVTNQVGEDGAVYNDGTMRYIENMGRLNRELSSAADCVIECVYGIPIILKGENPLCR